MNKIQDENESKKIVKHIYGLRTAIDNYLVRSIENSGAKGLMVSHGDILLQLYQKDRRSMSQIAGSIGKCKSTLTVLVDKLEQADFIRREASEQDVRVKNLCLTEKGRAFEKSFWEISENLNACLWEGFSPKEQSELLASLQKMQANLNKINFASKK